MSVASLVRSAVSGVGPKAAALATRADAKEQEVQLQNEIHFETFAPTDVESDVEEAVLEDFVKSPVSSARKQDGNESCWFSIGSEKHMSGSCKPCAFFHLPEGCQNGSECQFCHQCPPREKQRRKRVRRRLVRETERAGQALARHSRQGSTTSSASASTWESGSTADSADYVASIGVASRQSSGSLESGGSVGQPLVPLGFVQAMVPVYGMPSSQGWQSSEAPQVDCVQTIETSPVGCLGFEYLPELHGAQVQQPQVEVVASEDGPPPTYTCAPTYAQVMTTTIAGCEQGPTSAVQPHQGASIYAPYGSYGSYGTPVMVPVTYQMEMPVAVQASPGVWHQSPPLAAPPTTVWRPPVCHVRGNRS